MYSIDVLGVAGSAVPPVTLSPERSWLATHRTLSAEDLEGPRGACDATLGCAVGITEDGGARLALSLGPVPRVDLALSVVEIVQRHDFGGLVEHDLKRGGDVRAIWCNDGRIQSGITGDGGTQAIQGRARFNKTIIVGSDPGNEHY